ncbi:hypothetical protein EV1_033638 [Malus domestica]
MSGFHKRKKKRRREAEHKHEEALRRKRLELRKKLEFVAICELEPGFYRECEGLMMKLHGRYGVLALSVHAEGDTVIDQYDDHEDEPSHSLKDSSNIRVEMLQGKQNKCSTCNAFVGDSKHYRDHFKREWHKHNLKRKTRQLPSLTEEECAADMEMDDYKADLRD